jgi:hypothetical protein
MNMTLFFAGLYLSEIWYSKFERDGSIHAKARAIVLFDRVITQRIPNFSELKESYV